MLITFHTDHRTSVQIILDQSNINKSGNTVKASGRARARSRWARSRACVLPFKKSAPALLLFGSEAAEVEGVESCFLKQLWRSFQIQCRYSYFRLLPTIYIDVTANSENSAPVWEEVSFVYLWFFWLAWISTYIIKRGNSLVPQLAKVCFGFWGVYL